MIHWFSDTDTMNFFENTIIREDTVFKKIYFSDSTLYWSEISIQDKTGRVIECHTCKTLPGIVKK
jgi:hypothetical protein